MLLLIAVAGVLSHMFTCRLPSCAGLTVQPSRLALRPSDTKTWPEEHYTSLALQQAHILDRLYTDRASIPLHYLELSGAALIP